MVIESLYWKEHILAKIIGRHGIGRGEVEEMIFDGDPEVRRNGERYLLFGQCSSGRYLLVVLEKSDEPGEFVPITARDMTEREKHAFKKRRKQ